MERVQGRDIFHSGVLFFKTREKNCVAQGKSCKGKNLKDLKIFQENKQTISHGDELLNPNLTREKQTHDTALRMCVHNPDMLFRLAHSSGMQRTQLLQTNVQIKHIIQADITRGYSALSVGDGVDFLPLADGKTQRSRRINLHLLSSWLLARNAALR